MFTFLGRISIDIAAIVVKKKVENLHITTLYNLFIYK